MKSRRLSSALFFCYAVCIASFAQEKISVPFQSILVFPSGVNPMIIWGVRNESVFHEGFALVKSNGKWGAIDKTGRIIIQPQFDQVGDFIAELKLIKLDGKAEFTDKTGKIVIQTQLEWIQNTINTLNQVELNPESGNVLRDFVDESTLIDLGRESGIIDNTNQVSIDPQFEWVNGFIDILALVELGRKLGFIDETGQIIIQPQMTDSAGGSTPIELNPELGNVVRDFVDESTLIDLGRESGIIDNTNQVSIDPQFEWVNGFIDILALVELGRKLGFIDETGQIIIQPQMTDSAEGSTPIELNPELGNVVRDFVDESTLIDLGRESGIIDNTNQVSIDPQFEWVNGFIDILALVELGRKLGFIDETGQIIIQPQMMDSAGGLTPIESDNKWGFVNKTGEIVIQPQFDSARNFTQGLAAIELNGKWGFINKAGKSLTYDNIIEQPRLIGDINGDKAVDIFDLVMVAGQFGKTGNNLLGDVNGDNNVNIFDLVIVAGNFGRGKIAAAPNMTKGIEFTINQKRNIESLVNQLESKYNLSFPEEIVLDLLRVVLTKQLPKKTQLLSNYPNPFNPETWIPFELHEHTNVSFTISDLRGNEVRRIDLGYTLSGKYTSHDKAIYWDGKNNNGERVASGTYFYTIQTNNYTQTKKMVILK